MRGNMHWLVLVVFLAAVAFPVLPAMIPMPTSAPVQVHVAGVFDCGFGVCFFEQSILEADQRTVCHC